MFNIGDLVVLLIVVIILAVYRQLDRNNRSIDKVKRFVERAQNEMDEVVSEKVTMLKDIGIEIDVHQKAARQILSRIQSVEDGLEKRSESMEEIAQRLGEYERALDELVQMTRRTEENIGRVRDESEYVDKVGRRIKAAQTKIEELNASLPKIVSGFETQNVKRMEEVESRFFAQGEQRFAQLDTRIEGAAARVQDFSEQVAQLQAETDEQVQKARLGLEELSDARERELNDRSQEILRNAIAEIGDAREGALEVASDITERHSTLRDEMDENVERVRALLDEQFTEYRERIDDLGNRGARLETEALVALGERIDADVARLREEHAGSVRSVLGELRSELDARVASFTERTEALDRGVEDWKERTHNHLAELEQQVAELRERSEREISDQRDVLDRRIAEVSEHFENHRIAVERGFAQVDRQLAEATAGATQRQEAALGDLRSEAVQRSDSISREMGEFAERFENQRTRLESLHGEMQDRLREVGAAADAGAVSLSERLDQFVNFFSERLGNDERELEARVFQAIDERLGEYENQVNYRFSRIEAVNADLDTLEETLRRAMERVSERVRGDFKRFVEEMNDRRDADRKESEDQMGLLHGEIENLEGRLNDLKEQAYVSVSEKLKVFEDEFFSDLREQSNRMDQRITEWNDEVESRLLAIGAEHAARREEYEADNDERLTQKFHELSGGVTARLAKAEEQIESFRSSLAARAQAADETLATFTEQVNAELADARERASLSMRQELGKYDTSMSGEIQNVQGRLAEDLRRVETDVRDRTSNLDELVESVRSEVTLWQTKVLSQLQGSEADVEAQLADFRVATSDNIRTIRSEYSDERDRLVAESAEERARITDELDRLSQRAEALDTALEEKSTTLLRDFDTRFSTLREEFDTYRRGVHATLESSGDEFRSFVADTREQLQSMQAKMFGKVEEETRVLTVNLQEIEKRQKAFVEQTRLFERADSLKIHLEEQIGALKTDLGRLETAREEVREIENQLGKIRRASADVTDKMARFMAEKRRVDLLEDDYRRLIELSQSAESKLEQINSREDQLQEVAVYLRSLEELQKEVAVRFDRLEKRRSQIDQTVDALEENNRALTDLEDRLKGVQDEVAVLPSQVGEITRQLESLSRNRENTDRAVAQLNALDSTLNDIETRMQSLQKAREWLAGTETRLGQLQREADEQIKLLGSIMREEVKKEAPRTGAPPSSVRETIQKLARQGWKVDEIARATKISKGEVELILELSSRVE